MTAEESLLQCSRDQIVGLTVIEIVLIQAMNFCLPVDLGDIQDRVDRNAGHGALFSDKDVVLTELGFDGSDSFVDGFGELGLGILFQDKPDVVSFVYIGCVVKIG